MAEKLGGKLLSAYVTTGQYDVALTLEMPNGEAMAKFASVHYEASCLFMKAGDPQAAGRQCVGLSGEARRDEPGREGTHTQHNAHS